MEEISNCEFKIHKTGEVTVKYTDSDGYTQSLEYDSLEQVVSYLLDYLRLIVEEHTRETNYAHAREMFKTQEDWDEMIRYLERKSSKASK